MTLGDNDKESDEQLIQNETDSHPLKSIISKTKTRAPTTVILETLKVWINVSRFGKYDPFFHFSRHSFLT